MADSVGSILHPSYVPLVHSALSSLRSRTRENNPIFEESVVFRHDWTAEPDDEEYPQYKDDDGNYYEYEYFRFFVNAAFYDANPAFDGDVEGRSGGAEPNADSEPSADSEGSSDTTAESGVTANVQSSSPAPAVVANSFDLEAGWKAVNAEALRPIESFSARVRLGSMPGPTMMIKKGELPWALDLDTAFEKAPFNQVWAKYLPPPDFTDASVENGYVVTLDLRRCFLLLREMYSRPINPDNMPEIEAALEMAQMLQEAAQTALNTLDVGGITTGRDYCKQFREWIAANSVGPIDSFDMSEIRAHFKGTSLDNEDTCVFLAIHDHVLALFYLANAMEDNLKSERRKCRQRARSRRQPTEETPSGSSEASKSAPVAETVSAPPETDKVEPAGETLSAPPDASKSESAGETLPGPSEADKVEPAEETPSSPPKADNPEPATEALSGPPEADNIESAEEIPSGHSEAGNIESAGETPPGPSEADNIEPAKETPSGPPEADQSEPTQ